MSGCIAILRGSAIDEDLVTVLGGPAARHVLDGYEGGPSGYWPRVWAAPGLLHVWDDAAASAVIEGTTDASWRVREMAAKVIGRHAVGEGLAAVVALHGDPVARVRAAAARANEVLVARGAKG